VPQLHFQLPLLLSDGEVASPILGVWVWLEPLAAFIAGDYEKAEELIGKLVQQTKDLCAARGVCVDEGKSSKESSAVRALLCV